MIFKNYIYYYSMITDIKIIKKELENFSQIEFPYDIKRNCHVKYLTLKDNQEYFYTGGKFIRFGNECLILENSNKTWSVPKYRKDKKGNILYSSKFFIQDNEEEITCTTEIKELYSIIKTQQHIIDKLSLKLKELSS